MIRVGDIVWYRHLGAPAELAAVVTYVHSATMVNLLVLDNGYGVLTDDLGACPQRDVVVRGTYAETEGGQCAPRGAA